MKQKLMKLAMVVGIVALLVGVGLMPIMAKATDYDLSLPLVSKSGDPDWFVTQGASGTLRYNPDGATFDFSFEATGLQHTTDYDLIYYADPWQNTNCEVLAGFITDGNGDISLVDKTAVLDENLPNSPDNNMTESYCELMCGENICNPDASTCWGAKIWLVLANDYDADAHMMVGWNPASYLFETDLINYLYEPVYSGEPSSGTVLPAFIGATISPLSLQFGLIAQGSISNVQDITITNTGSVAIKVTVSITNITGTLFTDCLELSNDGIAWTVDQDWNYPSIPVGEGKVVKARLNVPAGYSLGTSTATVFFMIQVATP